MMRMLKTAPEDRPARPEGAAAPSALRNWPVQLHLLPVQAPFFKGATVLLAADCVPFAHPDGMRNRGSEHTWSSTTSGDKEP